VLNIVILYSKENFGLHRKRSKHNGLRQPESRSEVVRGGDS